jgi:putative ABC transport system ATP-binding protein
MLTENMFLHVLLLCDWTDQEIGIRMDELTTLQTSEFDGTPAQEQRRVVMDVRAVTKSLPLGREQIAILKGISFQIFQGDFVSIVGPSGSGKSTLLGIIAGLDNPSTGQVLIDGVDITHMAEGKLADVRNHKIGMVFQAYNLIPTLTAQENVEVPLYVGNHPGSPSKRAKELLALVVSPIASLIVQVSCRVANSSAWRLRVLWQPILRL